MQMQSSKRKPQEIVDGLLQDIFDIKLLAVKYDFMATRNKYLDIAGRLTNTVVELQKLIEKGNK